MRPIRREMAMPPRWTPTALTDLDPQAVEQLPRRALPPGATSVADFRWDCPGHHTHDPIARARAVTEYAVRLAGRADLLHAVRNELAGVNLACRCPLDSRPCHREVLLDIANPPVDPYTTAGHTMGLTLRRPSASILLVPKQLGGSATDTRSWSTDYRGPVAIYAGTRIDEGSHAAASALGLDANWHTAQTGWLGAAVLLDTHLARPGCCAAAELRPRRGIRLYHWVFTAPARLALRTYGRGFAGLRAVSWSVLVRRSNLR
jgi:hypothetical protein